jgi:ABC-type bacteriocin/lantibiotic exporter with double-glycine peptidase domain
LDEATSALDKVNEKAVQDAIDRYRKTHGNITIIVIAHRLLMEKHLGRKLTKNEIVHHIDNNPTNDNPENLQVMTQKEHARLHFKGKKDD